MVRLPVNCSECHLGTLMSLRTSIRCQIHDRILSGLSMLSSPSHTHYEEIDSAWYGPRRNEPMCPGLHLGAPAGGPSSALSIADGLRGLCQSLRGVFVSCGCLLQVL